VHCSSSGEKREAIESFARLTRSARAKSAEPGRLGNHYWLAACRPGAPPAPAAGARKGVERFSYPWSQQSPELKCLSTQLGHYAFENLHEKLGLALVLGAECNLDEVLSTCLVPNQDSEKNPLSLPSAACNGVCFLRAEWVFSCLIIPRDTLSDKQFFSCVT
jgi:hypothetical protein